MEDPISFGGRFETVMAAKPAKPKTRGGIDRSNWATAGELADRVSEQPGSKAAERLVYCPQPDCSSSFRGADAVAGDAIRKNGQTGNGIDMGSKPGPVGQRETELLCDSGFPRVDFTVVWDQKNRTAIERAVFYGHANVCHKLIDHGCDIHARDEVCCRDTCYCRDFLVLMHLLSPVSVRPNRVDESGDVGTDRTRKGPVGSGGQPARKGHVRNDTVFARRVRGSA